uniref:Asparaginase n=1 Tax=Candidatus Kentrum sp. LFY TaxID=2126342 RepID=A0A450U5R1_9GAMM|nr:MAG: Asparaginase [Candidatus Kentron sp. LFY]
MTSNLPDSTMRNLDDWAPISVVESRRRMNECRRHNEEGSPLIMSGLVKPRPKQPTPVDFRPHFADGIIQFSLIPGLEPETLLPVLESPACKGVVLQSFGAGNVPNEDKYSFKGFIGQAVKLGKPVIVASQFPANSTLASHYAPGMEAVQAGAITTGNMTNAATTAKFRWVLYQVEEKVKKGELSGVEKLAEITRMMNHVYVGEMTPLAS